MKVKTPWDLTDSMHVELLASLYVKLLTQQSTWISYEAKQYSGRQWNFALYFAKEMGRRLLINPRLEVDAMDVPIFEGESGLEEMTYYRDIVFEWSNAVAWDELAKYYSQTLDIPARRV